MSAAAGQHGQRDSKPPHRAQRADAERLQAPRAHTPQRETGDEGLHIAERGACRRQCNARPSAMPTPTVISSCSKSSPTPASTACRRRYSAAGNATSPIRAPPRLIASPAASSAARASASMPPCQNAGWRTCQSNGPGPINCQAGTMMNVTAATTIAAPATMGAAARRIASMLIAPQSRRPMRLRSMRRRNSSMMRRYRSSPR